MKKDMDGPNNYKHWPMHLDMTKQECRRVLRSLGEFRIQFYVVNNINMIM